MDPEKAIFQPEEADFTNIKRVFLWIQTD